MKFLLSTTFSLFFSLIAYAQDSFQKNGAYLSYEEYKNNSPTYEMDFIPIKRGRGEIKAVGGNDYKFDAVDEVIKKKDFKQEVWGVVYNDTLFLNGIPLSGIFWYAKVELLDSLSFLEAAYPASPKVQKELGLNSSNTAYMFGAAGGAMHGAKLALMRIPLVIKLESNERWLGTKDNLIVLSNNEPEIISFLDTLENDLKKDKIIEVLQLINQ